ncbi:protein DpdH [Ferrimonas senticii]|uniref:protein DpdH n=1 Tax=Ferrimonas senticii TaxID=394566 RepID=UPI0004038AC8|nr:protein DpdH [Ferrimonas senticii]
MELMNYWPSQEGIRQCIRTEAEELAETTLLAVHEPMVLRKDGMSSSTLSSDNDLLAEFMESERPLPIIGRSGVGKSHLIRWLDAKLATHPESVDWHRVRIPKNASLRQVLEKLLDGLEGELFEDARNKIHQVGEQKRVDELAEELLLEMGQQLTRIEVEARKEALHLRETGQLTPEKTEHLQARVKHCGRNGLRVMLNDPEIKDKFFLTPDHCIYQFAQRMLQGASNKTLEGKDYKIHGKDLDFCDALELDDVSAPAAQYIQRSRLNTDARIRDEIADILNEVLGDATRVKFEQMFRYRGGSFQDLFKEIRQYLHQQGRTLVVLVEDMAAISAIEDVLIDSLLEEGIRDGERTLCPLRSAIAVTDGYPGYVRRQGTIKTRAQAEWWIEESSDDQQQLMQRIINFCGRYLNAARYGAAELSIQYKQCDEHTWPPVWHDSDGEADALQYFGQAERPHVPLFPLSRYAIEVLVKHHCLDGHGQLQFNPRLVINLVLLAIVRDSAVQVRQGTFPHGGFAGINGELELQSELIDLGIDDLGRAMSLAAIWGGRAENLSQLRQRLPAQVAMAFGLPQLAQHLSQDGVSVVPIQPISMPTAGGVGSAPTPKAAPKAEAPAKDPFVKEVDAWLQQGTQLSQNTAKDLRNALKKQLELKVDEELIAAKVKKSLTVNKVFMCSIPNANGNNEAMRMRFFDDKLLKEPYATAAIRKVTLALLRWASANNGNDIGYGYSHGAEDYIAIKDFMDQWLPAQLPIIINSQREAQLEKALQQHLKLAYQLALIDSSMTTEVKLNQLLLTANNLLSQNKELYRLGIGELRLDNAREVDRDYLAKALAKWAEAQSAWLDLVNSQNRAIAGDLVKIALLRADKQLRGVVDSALEKQVKRSHRDIEELEQGVKLFAGCSQKEEFEQLIERWLEVLTQLKKADKYPVDAPVKVETMRARIKSLTDENFWTMIKAVRAVALKEDVHQQWIALQQLPLQLAKKFGITIESWNTIHGQISARLQAENAGSDAQLVVDARERTESILNQTQNDLNSLMQES